MAPLDKEERREYLIGVDGGGTATRAVVQRRGGEIVGMGTAGPSALGQGIPQAWRHIEQAVQAAFDQAKVVVAPRANCVLAAGLSGVSHPHWREQFISEAPGYRSLVLESDSYAMLLGAHDGAAGVIVIAGTGSIAEALHSDGTRVSVGGWGFPVGDEGSGAWLGLQAVRHTQSVIDGRANPGPLARQVAMRCGDERESLLAWCSASGQFAYAQLARAVFECESTDPVAAALLQAATGSLEELALAADPRGRLPVAVSGSIGERLAPRMRPAVRARLVPVKNGAAMGALTLARRGLQKRQETTA